jgi:glucose-6-phosphate isomerase
MNATKAQIWDRFQEYYREFPSAGLALDISRVDFPDDFFAQSKPAIDRAFAAMTALEAGAIANPDEKRMVGHYWLRDSALAPTKEIAAEIEGTLKDIEAFAAAIHSGQVKGAAGPFKNVLVIGIGGSALGPQFVANALGHPKTDKMGVFFFDNTDPDGIDRTLARLDGQLGATLALVISKSGGTPETRNGMLEAKSAYEKAGFDFGKHAVAVTGMGSALHKSATAGNWLKSFPMWDWVGGRTSELSAVGLLPAALQGLDIRGMLAGAKATDAVTRVADASANPAAQLALCWHFLGGGKGSKDMVVLPYKDRLELFAKYLQQLVMESLGKELDLDGKVVNQGIAVYGNKGSTDQHAYVQQLRDGVDNFFVVFIEVLRDRATAGIEVEPGVTSGDFLNGFLLGTRQALHEKGRQSITITVPEANAFTVGALIALFERAVGLYASLVHINAYHQPGVEAGKKAAGIVLALKLKAETHLKAHPGRSFTAAQVAAALGSDDSETLFKILQHLAANPGSGLTRTADGPPAIAQFGFR